MVGRPGQDGFPGIKGERGNVGNSIPGDPGRNTIHDCLFKKEIFLSLIELDQVVVGLLCNITCMFFQEGTDFQDQTDSRD